MKRFTVQIKDIDGDVSTITTDSIIKAYEHFAQPVLHSHIMDNETGEVYATMDCEIGEDTTLTTQNISNDFLQSLFEEYEYGNTDFEIMED